MNKNYSQSPGDRRRDDSGSRALAIRSNGSSIEQSRSAEEMPSFDNPDVLVTFLVGPGESKFLVHKEVACHYSPVLAAGFNGPFVEGQTHTYKLDDIAEGTFRFFVQWLYSQKIKLLVHGGEEEEWMGREERSAHFAVCNEQDRLLVDLWVLADKLLIPELQDLTVDLIERVRQRCGAVAVHCVKQVYQQTTADSPLRRLFVHYCAWTGNPDLVKSNLELFPPEMLADLVSEFHSAVPENTRQKQNRTRNMENYYINKDAQ